MKTPKIVQSLTPMSEFGDRQVWGVAKGISYTRLPRFVSKGVGLTDFGWILLKP